MDRTLHENHQNWYPQKLSHPQYQNIIKVLIKRPLKAAWQYYYIQHCSIMKSRSHSTDDKKEQIYQSHPDKQIEAACHYYKFQHYLTLILFPAHSRGTYRDHCHLSVCLIVTLNYGVTCTELSDLKGSHYPVAMCLSNSHPFWWSHLNGSHSNVMQAIYVFLEPVL